MIRQVKIKILVNGRLAHVERVTSDDDFIAKLPTIEKRFVKKRAEVERTIARDLALNRITEVRYEYKATPSGARRALAVAVGKAMRNTQLLPSTELVCPVANPN